MGIHIDWNAGIRKNQVRVKVDQLSFKSFDQFPRTWRGGRTWTEKGRKKRYYYRTLTPPKVIIKKKAYTGGTSMYNYSRNLYQAKVNLQKHFDNQRKFRRKLNRIYW